MLQEERPVETSEEKAIVKAPTEEEKAVTMVSTEEGHGGAVRKDPAAAAAPALAEMEEEGKKLDKMVCSRVAIFLKVQIAGVFTLKCAFFFQAEEFDEARAKANESQEAARLAIENMEAALKRLEASKQASEEICQARAKHIELEQKLKHLDVEVRHTPASALPILKIARQCSQTGASTTS